MLFIAPIGLVAGILISLTGALFLHFNLNNLLFAPIRFCQLLGIIFGRKKRYWGVVYDSTTGEVLDPARIYLEDLTGARLRATWTDAEGHYGFQVEKGIYKIFVSKRGYAFPSTKLFGKNHDEFYENLYLGGEVVINTKDEDVKYNIPLDRQKPLFSPVAPGRIRRRARRRIQSEKWLHRLLSLIYSLGFVYAVASLFFTPNLYNAVIFSLFVLLIILRRIGVLKYKYKGSVALTDGEPAAYAILRVYLVGAPKETARTVTDRYGRYYLPVPNGVYVVKIIVSTKMGYFPVLTSNPITVEKKMIHEHFRI